MKVRQTFPRGQASASKVKAMLLCIDAEKGAAAADAWIDKLRLGRADVDDETRLLPLGALHVAAKSFETEVEGAFARLPPYLVARDNLGVWARVLRGTRSPEDAFGRIDASESEHGRTTRWETLTRGAGHWKGKVHVHHDPDLEKDGCLARLRAAELSVVPMLFGFPRAVVATVGEDPNVFEVRWAVPSPRSQVALWGASGAAIGAGVLAAQPSWITAIAALALPVLSGGVGVVAARGRISRIEASAQANRVAALERSLALREEASASSAGDLEGSVVAGLYRIGARMGSGASGVIYEAVRITDGLPVALKLLRAASAHDVVASDRLRREAEALGLSWHPNVVELIEHGHLPDGTSYLVMELLRGESLAHRLKHRVRLTPDELFPIALQLAEALVAVHAAGVVHRDLKPSNVFVVHDGDGERVKVLDFGIARVEWEEMRITNMGAPLGTPGYMSPEQESGGEVDARSDVFALGALLYECLVGEPPPPSADDLWKPGSFAKPRPDAVDTLRRIAQAESGVRPASRRMPSAAPAMGSADAPPPVAAIPAAWRAIVERALARRPEERFQDARGLLASVRALRESGDAERPGRTPADGTGGAG